MQKYAIIVAGGKGSRMQSAIPKQFMLLAGIPILIHTLKRFYQYDSQLQIILVLPSAEIGYWQELCQKYNCTIPHKIVEGGKTRFHSVLKGLNAIHSDGLIAVHDGVRPFVSQETIAHCFNQAQLNGTAVPCLQVIDSIRYYDETENKALNRNNYCLIQTPQVFAGKLLKKAYEQDFSETFTDDAGVVESLGEKINLVDGNRENIKVTTPYDLELAEKFLLRFFE